MTETADGPQNLKIVISGLWKGLVCHFAQIKENAVCCLKTIVKTH